MMIPTKRLMAMTATTKITTTRTRVFALCNQPSPDEFLYSPDLLS
jgi:hypothetical protein